MPRRSQLAVPLMGGPQGIPTNTPDQFPAQAEGLGGPCGTRGTPTPYGAIRASNLAQDHLKVVLCIFRGPYCPIEGGDAPRATEHTQAFGLGRELVGCVRGDTLRASHKRDGHS